MPDWLLTLLLVAIMLAGPVWLALTIHAMARAARADGVAVSHRAILGLMLRNDRAARHRRRPGPGEPPLYTARGILDTARRASLAGLGVSVRDVETQALAGGDPALCVDALIAARSRSLRADWKIVICIDLAGYDPLAAAEAGANLIRVIGAPEYAGMFLKPTTPPNPPRPLFAR